MSSTTATTTQWAANEFRHVRLGDRRLDERLKAIAAQRIAMPCNSLPHCCGNWANLKGTYRFMDNVKVDPDKILESHKLCTVERMQGEPVVLLVQDTTLLDYSHLQATKGLGVLQTAKQQGLVLHSTLAVRPDRMPLGILQWQVWARPAEDFGKRAKRRQRNAEDKESFKWVSALESTADVKSKAGETLIVHVADREADVYLFFERSLELGLPVLVRGCWQRNVEEPEGKLWAHMEGQPVIGSFEITVQRQADEPARQARLSLRYAPVTLRAPVNGPSGHAPLSMWAVLAREEDRPEDERIEWLLLTTLPVTTEQEARRMVDWYACRWTIEMFHKVLKSGCLIEKRRFGEAERLIRYLALDMVVAWRVLYLTLAGRKLPDMPCTAIFEEPEWQALHCYLNKTRDPPTEAPTLGQVVRSIAKLGGFLARTGDGDPGTETIWKGMVRLLDIAQSWRSFGPQTTPQRCG